jgi:aminopeptidase N
MKEGQPKAIELSEYRVPPYLISTTELQVDLNEDVSYVTSTLTITKNPESKSDSHDLVLNGSVDLDTQTIKIDGRELLSNEYAIEGDQLTLFSVPPSFELETNVALKPQENTALEGLYKSGDMYCTQCEAEGFRNITWYLDRPDVMSQYRTTIQADKALYPILLSNGNEVARGDAGAKHWVTWEDPFKKPAYLFAMVAGDLEHVEDHFTTMSGRDVTLQIFTESHNIDKVDFAMTALKNSMAWDEKTYGREYDLDIFMIVAVESFNMGAMENKGLNIFNTSCVLARPDTTTDAGYQRVEAVVAHEYFHNWSGNRVTCRDWFQLSLKEGFTVLRDQQFSADMGSETVCRVADVATLRNAQFPEDAGPMAHPIRPGSYIEINNFYTATVYEKGAEVVRMIRTLLGEDNFRKGTDHYFDRHDGQAVTTEDFVRAMEDANDADLSQFRYWYSQAGTPVLDVSDNYDEAAKTYSLTIEQSCPATPGQDDKQAFHMPIALGLLGADGQDIEFDIDGVDVAHVITDNQYTAVLNLRESSQRFVFSGVNEKPVVSLLRGFSAPVKLSFDSSRDDLQFLMQHDSDGFNRWEAGQRLAVAVIQDVVAQIQQGQTIDIDTRIVTAIGALLDEAVNYNQQNHSAGGQIDKAMLADMLVMPAEAYLAELTEVADVDAIHTARDAVRLLLLDKLQGLFLSVYKLNQSSAGYQIISSDVAQRGLKNVCLSYLMMSSETEAIDLCVAQFESADNMTDTGAAIRALINCPAEAAVAPREKALTAFYERWSAEALVIDQWFGMQASSPLPGAMDRVKNLLEHDAFTMKNPNRMRSVVVSFAFQNTVNFHKKDGSGYEFLADRVIELNGINPQMAARVLSPLTRWRKYDAERQTMMKAQLTRILDQEKLSPDVFEIASKSI